MPNPVQWTVDAFYGELKKLDAAGRSEILALNEQKLRLQDSYTLARNAGNKNVMDALKPLISKNSQMRLAAADYKAKFNSLVNSVSGLLRKAGISVPPTLSGLGVAPALIIIPAAVVVSLGICWGIVYRMTAGRTAVDHALESNLPTLLAIARDMSRPPAERKAAMDSANKLMDNVDNAGKGDGVSDMLGQLTPILGLVALIVVAPSLLRLLPGRREAA